MPKSYRLIDVPRQVIHDIVDISRGAQGKQSTLPRSETVSPTRRMRVGIRTFFSRFGGSLG